MATLSTEAIHILRENLVQQIRDESWKRILLVMSITGVADNQQLIQSCGLNRDKLRRTLDKMVAASSGHPPLFSVYTRKMKRMGERGASPRVYRLGESGAALCKFEGVLTARTCQLEEQRSVQHALGMLDLNLSAKSAGLEVETDKNINYAENKFVRPDNVVILKSGTKALFESEQDARSDFLNRILRSIANKIDFYKSKASDPYSNIVRILVDLPRGKIYQRTINTWLQAVEISRETEEGDLPFQIYAMPLGEFLARPDWQERPEAGRWVELTATPRDATELSSQSLEQTAISIPGLSSLERKMILAALYQDLCERGYKDQNSLPDVEFLYLMRLIYSASHDPFAPAINRSGVPFESLYLLDQYLRMNPDLRKLIEQVTHMDDRRIHWNQSTALHRMQVVVDAFLEYHGWQSDGPLNVYSYTPDYQSNGPRRLSVAVEIKDPEILMSDELEIVPGKEEIRVLEKALSWVLTSMFSQTHHLNLKKPVFW